MHEQEIEALRFACKYSVIPNELEYCGKKGAFHSFLEFIKEPKEEKIPAIKELLESFYGAHSYLELIARANGKKTFDFNVLEAYWLGNELLEKVSSEEIQKMILGFEKFGLPKNIAETKAFSLPKGILAHHSMHVLHVNFITKKLEPIVENLSNCLVQWAEVKGIEKEKIKVKGIELKSLNKKFVLEEKIKKLENPFSLLPAKGDFITAHWNNAIEVITEDEFKNLKKITMKNVEAINTIL